MTFNKFIREIKKNRVVFTALYLEYKKETAEPSNLIKMKSWSKILVNKNKRMNSDNKKLSFVKLMKQFRRIVNLQFTISNKILMEWLKIKILFLRKKKNRVKMVIVNRNKWNWRKNTLIEYIKFFEWKIEIYIDRSWI